MTTAVLTTRHLNRALLTRQQLLGRAYRTIPDMLAQAAGLQTQFAPAGYLGLWTRLRDFERPALTQALEDHSAVQGTLMRTTIHLVDARDYWRFAVGTRDARRRWGLRHAERSGRNERDLRETADRLREALADGPKSVSELDGLADGFLGFVGLWVDLVRVPPSGTWERRRSDRIALAESWVGPEDATAEEGRRHLVRAYLGAFGPAPWRDIASWAGVPVSELRSAADDEAEPLVRYQDEQGGELLDLPDAVLPDPDTPAATRFLAPWDAVLAAHARRAGVLPDTLRTAVFPDPNPFSHGAVIVDGTVAGTWGVRDGDVVVHLLRELLPAEVDEVEAERVALKEFYAA